MYGNVKKKDKTRDQKYKGFEPQTLMNRTHHNNSGKSNSPIISKKEL